MQQKHFVSRIEIKGLAEPRNPGHGIWAFSVINSIGREYYYKAGYIGNGVSNYFAEYRALIEALRYCEKYGWHEVSIRSGLNVLVKQVHGEWGVADNLAPYCTEAQLLLEKTHCSIEQQINSRDNYASSRAKEAYWAALHGKLQPEPLVLLTKLEVAIQNEPKQLPLFG